MLLTIDIGTSSLKSSIWDENIYRISFNSIPLKIKDNNDYKHEINPSVWLRAFDESINKIKNDNKNIIHEIKAIVISGNGPSLVPVTGELSLANNVLEVSAQNARLWLDTRAVKYQKEISELMGGYVDASFFLPKTLYIKNEENEIYNRIKYFLGCPEYLAYALTGEAKSVFPCEGFERWFWNNKILEKLNLDSKKFPPFIRPGELFGVLTEKVSAHYGFKKNIPVISGGPDFFAAVLGSGVKIPGEICDRTGSSEGINLCVDSHVIDKRLMSYRHPAGNFWNLSGIINTTGKAIDWGIEILGLNNFDEFISLAKKSKPGSGGIIFIPYLAGERAPIWNPSARSMWNGISLSSSRNDFASSILEGIGYAIRDVISVMEESGVKAEQLRVTGKLAGCAALNQIKADITGLPVLEGNCKESELLGLAIIGACYLGKFKNYTEASSAAVKIEKTYEPNIKHKAMYDELFDKYKKIRNVEL